MVFRTELPLAVPMIINLKAIKSKTKYKKRSEDYEKNPCGAEGEEITARCPQRLMMKKQFIDIVDLFVSEVNKKVKIMKKCHC